MRGFRWPIHGIDRSFLFVPEVSLPLSLSLSLSLGPLTHLLTTVFMNWACPNSGFCWRSCLNSAWIMVAFWLPTRDVGMFSCLHKTFNSPTCRRFRTSLGSAKSEPTYSREKFHVNLHAFFATRFNYMYMYMCTVRYRPKTPARECDCGCCC